MVDTRRRLAPRARSVLALCALFTLAPLTALAQAPAPSWTYRFGSDENENVFDLAVAPDGRAYLAGSTQGELERPTEGFFDGFVHAVAPDGSERWTRQIGSHEMDFVRRIAIAPNGDVVAAGTSSGAIAGPSAGGDDAFVIRFAQGGKELWRSAIGSAGADAAYALAVSDDGTIYVGGSTDGDLAGEPAGGDDLFLVAMEPDGTERWRRQDGSPSDEVLHTASPAPNGGVYAAISSTGDLDGTNAGGWDVYLRLYDGTGEVTWRAGLHDEADLRAYGLTTGPDGGPIVAGGGPERPDDMPDVPVFVRAFGPDGEPRWSTSFGPARRDMGHSIAVAADGTVFVAVTSEGELAGPNAGVADAALVALNADGNERWRLQVGSARFDDASGVAIHPGGVLLAGNSQGQLPGATEEEGFDDDGYLRLYPF